MGGFDKPFGASGLQRGFRGVGKKAWLEGRRGRRRSQGWEQVFVGVVGCQALVGSVGFVVEGRGGGGGEGVLGGGGGCRAWVGGVGLGGGGGGGGGRGLDLQRCAGHLRTGASSE